ncbi:MAG: hypothetical protein AAFX03_02525 [Pseudomonadota bacterium]
MKLQRARILIGRSDDDADFGARVCGALKALEHNTLAAAPTVAGASRFQAGFQSYAAALDAVFDLEQTRMADGRATNPRYAAVIGACDIGDMTGPAVSRAKDLLERPPGRGAATLQCATGVPPLDELIEKNIIALHQISGKWSARDHQLVAAMISDPSDARVGDRFGKNRSQIWKRRKTLMIDSYIALRDAILAAARLVDEAVGPPVS